MKHLLNFALITAALFTASRATAQIPRPISEVDLSKLVKDVTMYSGNSDDKHMSVWMPTEYMRAAGAQMSNIEPEVIDFMTSTLEEYSMFCVSKHKIISVNGQARIKAVSEQEMRKMVTIEIDGKSYKPLQDSELTEEARNLKEMMGPMLKSMMGNFGEGMVILMFRIKSENNGNLLNPYGNNSFILKMGDVKLAYALPMAALYEDKICTEDNALFPSNYVYCPFHGKELEEQFPGDIPPPPVEGEDLPPPIDRQ